MGADFGLLRVRMALGKRVLLGMLGWKPRTEAQSTGPGGGAEWEGS